MDFYYLYLIVMILVEHYVLTINIILLLFFCFQFSHRRCDRRYVHVLNQVFYWQKELTSEQIKL